MRAFNRWGRLVAALLLALTAALVTAGVAQAGGVAPRPKWNTTRLESAYRHRLSDMKATDAWLADAELYATKLDTIIAEHKANGQDTVVLVDAVAIFRAKVNRLHTDNEAVLTRLTLNSGFDPAGKVLDKALAERTVKDAEAMLNTIEIYGNAAFVDLHKAIKDYQSMGSEHKFQEPDIP
jgi:hypothetical protein